MQEPDRPSTPLPAWKVSEPYRRARFPILSLLALLSGLLSLASALTFIASGAENVPRELRAAGLGFFFLSLGLLVGTLMLGNNARKRGEHGFFSGCSILGCLLAFGAMGVISLAGFVGLVGH